MRIALFGSGPWPLEEGAKVTGPAIRLRQFAEPLIAAGHEVHVVLLEDQVRGGIDVRGAASATALPVEMQDPGYVLSHSNVKDAELAMGVGSLMPALAAVRLARHLSIPSHADFFGDPLAELHALQTAPGESLDPLARDHIWKLYREALLGADHWSTVSTPEKHALIGQLGLLGQFGQSNDIVQRISVLPCAVPEEWLEKPIRQSFPDYLSELGLKADAPWVVFTGTWNAWLDIDAMSETLHRAMDRTRAMYFVVRGIPTHAAGERMQKELFTRLGDFSERIIAVSPEVDVSEDQILAHAPASLCLDRDIPESMLGDRNRLLSQVRWGVRPIVSRHAEVCRKLHRSDLADSIKDNDPEEAATKLIAAATRSTADRLKASENARDWLRDHTFSATVQPILEWIENGAQRREQVALGGQVDRWSTWLSEKPRSTPGGGLFSFLKRG